jgi:cell fate (sporulation/competence/biofilm development) regulator YlbF (YheA/YmcA/DUF963 family)
VIVERAQELGKIIGQSDEYKALKKAHEQVQQRDELQQRMNKLQGLAETLERSAELGSEPSPEQVNEYNELLSTIQADSNYQSVVVAQASFDKLMMKVNELILEGIKKGSASPIITLS